MQEEIGALPGLAHSLAALAGALEARAGPGDVQAASDRRSRARQLAERVGMPVLLERLARPADEWSLGRDGDDWLLEAGAERARLGDGRGLHYLRALLAAPGRDIPALDLAAGGAGLATTGTGPPLDAAARADYRRRLGELEAELDAADRFGDTARAARAEAERRALVGELRRASGLGGRARTASPEAERARVNVTRTLRATIDKIALAAPRLRRPSAGLGPHRPGLPLRPRSGRPQPLARLGYGSFRRRLRLPGDTQAIGGGACGPTSARWRSEPAGGGRWSTSRTGWSWPAPGPGRRSPSGPASS
jgi:hypothetical protein